MSMGARMPRRRIRLSWPSDEETGNGGADHHELQDRVSSTPFQSETLDPPNFQSEPLQISDDDEQEFIDVSDRLSPPSPDSDHSLRQSPEPNPPSPGLAPNDSYSCPISEFLRSLGLCLKREWLDACVRGLETSIPGFSSLNPEDKGKLCFEQFLVSDMNYSGAGVLPENVDSMHLVDLPGPYVLQVDEIINISCPLKVRYQTAPFSIKRCLKLSMTDGVQRVFGMEYRPIKDLEVLAPAGLKVVICNVVVRHGLLMLVPQALEVLGGVVEELDAARQRLVNEVNKPARGRRTRSGAVPPLASRATVAAWSSNNVQEPRHPSGLTGAETSLSNRGVDTFHREHGTFTVPSGRANADSDLSSNFVSSVEGVHAHSIPNSRAGAEPNIMFESAPSSNFVSRVEEIHTHPTPDCSATAEPNIAFNSQPSSHFVSSVEGIHTHSIPNSRAGAEPNIVFNSVSTVEDTNMVDVDHPVMLSGDQEMPFTYMASLSTKWATMKETIPSVHGKIKCFLTGVKGFQFKGRTTYELQVYIDDGSLISEVLIDHKVVQKVVGHPPKDVTDALASSDVKVVSDMRETMRRFQAFLINFEGTMLVEMNKTSPLPLVLDMNLGCLESAWPLLRRLKCSNATARTEERTALDLDPIDISP